VIGVRPDRRTDTIQLNHCFTERILKIRQSHIWPCHQSRNEHSSLGNQKQWTMPVTCYVPHCTSIQAAQLHDVVFMSTKASNSPKNGQTWSARILVPHLMQTRCHVAIVLAGKVLRNSINTVSRLFVRTVL